MTREEYARNYSGKVHEPFVGRHHPCGRETGKHPRALSVLWHRSRAVSASEGGMTLPARIRKEPKRASRWVSIAHRDWVKGFCCCVCGSDTNIAAAHVRLGSHTAMGAKPDDWRVVPLCDGPHSSGDKQLGCHNRQHIVGERTFWNSAKLDPEALIEELISASPKRREIEAVRKERGR